ncbi:hypothetical protein EOM57_04680 [Candidatus Saccharibacteria bacterium]|nr:hypothetical protein [Candidatus Saccharibacteria bacterium]
MLFPHERYLTVLLLKGLSYEEITSKLRSLRLPIPEEYDINSKRDTLFENIPDELLCYVTPGNKYNLNTFVTKAGSLVNAFDIDELIPVLKGNEATEWLNALYVVTDKYLGPLTLSMLVAQKTNKEIQEECDKSYNFTPSEESLELVRKYFWDCSRLSRMEVRYCIASITDSITKSAMTNAVHNKLQDSQWRLTGENTLTLEKILVTVMNEAYDKFQTSMLANDTDNAAKASRWADLAIKAAEKYNKVSSDTKTNIIRDFEIRLNKLSQDDIVNSSNFKGQIV